MPPAAPPPPQRRMVSWDPTISLGNVVTALTLLVTFAGLWARLEGRVEMHGDRLGRLEEQRRDDDRETSAFLQRFATMVEAQRGLVAAVDRIERNIERLSGAQQRGDAPLPGQPQRPF